MRSTRSGWDALPAASEVRVYDYESGELKRIEPAHQGRGRRPTSSWASVTSYGQNCSVCLEMIPKGTPLLWHKIHKARIHPKCQSGWRE